VIELVLQRVAQLLRFGHQRLAPLQRAAQARDVVFDVGELLLVHEPILFELRLARLQLGDGLYQPRLAIEHRQLELGVRQPQQRLARLDDVARFDHHAFHAAAFDGIQVDGLARHDPRTQRDEIGEGAACHRRDAELPAFHAQVPLTVEQEREQQPRGHQRERAGRNLEAPLAPPRQGDGAVHGKSVHRFRVQHTRSFSLAPLCRERAVGARRLRPDPDTREHSPGCALSARSAAE
jgi:hypothetical protein